MLGEKGKLIKSWMESNRKNKEQRTKTVCCSRVIYVKLIKEKTLCFWEKQSVYE